MLWRDCRALVGFVNSRVVVSVVFFVFLLEGDPSSSLLSTVASRALILDRGVNGSGEPVSNAGDDERGEAIDAELGGISSTKSSKINGKRRRRLENVRDTE